MWNDSPTAALATPCRTLMWIGPRDSSEFRECYALAESSSLQIAYRYSIRDALERPASTVDRIVIARRDRGAFDWNQAIQLIRHSVGAEGVILLSSLCEGVRHAERFAIAAAVDAMSTPLVPIVNAAAWRDVVPAWLSGAGLSGAGQETPPQRPASKMTVAVLASCLSAAEPLLDLASIDGATAVWLRSAESQRIRNIDRVIWDDSVAPSGTKAEWQIRMASVDTVANASHAWIATCPRVHQAREAEAAGVELVLSKPHSIDGLVTWMRAPRGSFLSQRSLAQRSLQRSAA